MSKINNKSHRGALSGTVVLSFEQATSGPFCTMILADLGAEVILIESPVRGRASQYQWRHKGEDVHFLALGRNKKSVSLDITRPEGKMIFQDLVKKSDVVFDNFRPGTGKKLGIDYETLEKINPRIISCSLTGYGPSGPNWRRPAFDRIIQAISGNMSLVGEEGRPPCLTGWAPVDTSGGMAAACGILAALVGRGNTGKGQKVDVSLLDIQVAILSSAAGNYLISGLLTGRMGGRWALNPLHGVFPAKDGYISMAAHRQPFWEKLCATLDREDLMRDPRFITAAARSKNGKELWSILDPIFLSKTVQEWVDIFGKADVPCGPVNTIDKALADPQVLYRNMVVSIPDNEGDSIKVLGNPFKLSDSEEKFTYPPAFGKDTNEVLSGLLGYSPEKIADLRNDRII